MAAKRAARPAVLAALAAAALATSALATFALAQPMQMPTPSHDYKDAPPGTYAIDPTHTSVIARVPHLGFSYSTFRFTGVSGTLGWNPADPQADTLTISVDPRSIATAAVSGFSDELQGPKFLNSAAYPAVTFAATAFRPQGPAGGVIEGDLSLLGVTRHISFEATLVGTGKGFHGPVIGVSAEAKLDPKLYSLPPFITAPIELYIDTEFDKQP